jgi:nucleoid-associated protein YgaU
MTTGDQRAIALVGLGGLASAGLVRLAWPAGVRLDGLLAALASQPPDRSLPLLLSLAMLLASGWAGVLLILCLAARLPGACGRVARRGFRRLAPAAVRRAIEVVLGASTVLAVTSGAAQAAGPAPRPAVAQPAVVVNPLLTGLDRPATAEPAVHAPVPGLDRPTAEPTPEPSRGLGLVTTVSTRSLTPQANPQQREVATVMVRPGDSLWRIAARALPRDSGRQTIERAWHRWYAANRGVIGPDPDLLQPGQQLTPPLP